jgi:hypothetical protein
MGEKLIHNTNQRTIKMFHKITNSEGDYLTVNINQIESVKWGDGTDRYTELSMVSGKVIEIDHNDENNNNFLVLLGGDEWKSMVFI